MRKNMFPWFLVLIAAGCDVAPQTEVKTDDQTEAKSDGWSLSKRSSGMDGEVLTAERTVTFDGTDVSFHLSVSCAKEKKVGGFSIESFVGDPQNPDPRSMFASSMEFNGFTHVLMPLGRVRVGDEEPEKLGPMFGVDEAFSNKIFLTPLYRSLNSPPDTTSKLKFPMVMEVQNGVGTFELRVDRSDTINQVLEACGVVAENGARSMAAGVQEPPSQGGPIRSAAQPQNASLDDDEEGGCTSELPKILGVKYGTARKVLLDSGYQPVAQEDSDAYGLEDHRALGYIEVESCTAAGAYVCLANFISSKGFRLPVRFAGEYEDPETPADMIVEGFGVGVCTKGASL